MSYYDKYSKYKTKYLNLQNQLSHKQRGGLYPESVLPALWGKGTDKSPFSLEDEIHFWGRQMAEHALFLHLGLEETGLKDQARTIQQAWEAFLEKTFYSRGIIVSNSTISLSEDDLQKITDVNINRVNELINITIDFKTSIITILNTGKWIGWIFPALAQHMLKEAEYFKRKVNGPAFDAGEEIIFINEHHGEEMGATAQLIDPNPAQQTIIDLVRSYGLKNMSKYNKGQFLADEKAPVPFPSDWTAEQEAVLKGINDDGNLLLLSIRYSSELTEFAKDTGDKIESNQLRSVISPILAHHVHREFARFTLTLEKLQ